MLSLLVVGVTTGVYMRQLGYTFMVQFAGCIASLVAVSLVAVIMDLFGKEPFMPTLQSFQVFGGCKTTYSLS